MCDSLGDVFPELRAQQQRVTDIIRDEEIAFGKTLERGIELFEVAAKAARAAGGVVSAQTRFVCTTPWAFQLT